MSSRFSLITERRVKKWIHSCLYPRPKKLTILKNYQWRQQYIGESSASYECSAWKFNELGIFLIPHTASTRQIDELKDTSMIYNEFIVN